MVSKGDPPILAPADAQTKQARSFPPYQIYVNLRLRGILGTSFTNANYLDYMIIGVVIEVKQFYHYDLCIKAGVDCQPESI